MPQPSYSNSVFTAVCQTFMSTSMERERSGHHLRGQHQGRNVRVHGAHRLHTQHQSRGPRSRKIYGTLPSEPQGAQHNRSIDLPVCGIGRSPETFGWVPQVTVGWAETCCATLWGCGMVHRGQNIVNSSQNPQFPPVMCALCPGRVRVVRAVRAVRTLCSARTPPVKPSPPPPPKQLFLEGLRCLRESDAVGADLGEEAELGWPEAQRPPRLGRQGYPCQLGLVHT